jgi:FKBP-type peptidyl-prolyl cis-trans isomerase 2
VAYIKLPKNSKNYPDTPIRFDRQDSYLLKHGNGQNIPGLDEGLHTMKIGGTRRILIPPKLGYVDVGLGPIPELPWNRWKLNQLLDQMVELSGGTVIYEVTLQNIIPDEADLGYYQDDSLTPEQFATLRENLRIRGNEELAAEAAQASITSGEDRIL